MIYNSKPNQTSILTSKKTISPRNSLMKKHTVDFIENPMGPQEKALNEQIIKVQNLL